MKFIIFIVLFILFFYLIPESPISSFVENHIHISGDGENAMDNFDTTVIAAKAAVSAVITLALLFLYEKIKRR